MAARFSAFLAAKMQPPVVLTVGGLLYRKAAWTGAAYGAWSQETKLVSVVFPILFSLPFLAWTIGKRLSKVEVAFPVRGP
jgi:hypothetical protein